MKKIVLAFLGSCLAITLAQCSSKTGSQPATIASPINIKNIPKENNTEESQTSKLLQGKWQNTEDKTNFLVFTENHRRETADGINDWDDEVFVLSDHCLNESDSSSHDKREKDSYISCKESDLCWNIVSLDSNSLTLMYMGRGNILTYRRVKE